MTPADDLKMIGVKERGVNEGVIGSPAGAANTMGTHGTRWRSDLTLRNPGNDPVEVRVFFLRSGGVNDLSTAPHRDLFLIAGETKEIRNFLGQELGLSGTGALLVSVSRALFPNNPPG